MNLETLLLAIVKAVGGKLELPNEIFSNIEPGDFLQLDQYEEGYTLTLKRQIVIEA
jgi:hypothetical protein